MRGIRSASISDYESHDIVKAAAFETFYFITYWRYSYKHNNVHRRSITDGNRNSDAHGKVSKNKCKWRREMFGEFYLPDRFKTSSMFHSVISVATILFPTIQFRHINQNISTKFNKVYVSSNVINIKLLHIVLVLQTVQYTTARHVFLFTISFHLSLHFIA